MPSVPRWSRVPPAPKSMKSCSNNNSNTTCCCRCRCRCRCFSHCQPRACTCSPVHSRSLARCSISSVSAPAQNTSTSARSHHPTFFSSTHPPSCCSRTARKHSHLIQHIISSPASASFHSHPTSPTYRTGILYFPFLFTSPPKYPSFFTIDRSSELAHSHQSRSTPHLLNFSFSIFLFSSSLHARLDYRVVVVVALISLPLQQRLAFSCTLYNYSVPFYPSLIHDRSLRRQPRVAWCGIRGIPSMAVCLFSSLLFSSVSGARPGAANAFAKTSRTVGTYPSIVPFRKVHSTFIHPSIHPPTPTPTHLPSYPIVSIAQGRKRPIARSPDRLCLPRRSVGRLVACDGARKANAPHTIGGSSSSIGPEMEMETTKDSLSLSLESNQSIRPHVARSDRSTSRIGASPSSYVERKIFLFFFDTSRPHTSSVSGTPSAIPIRRPPSPTLQGHLRQGRSA
jgi:hypothetical protein